MTIRPLHNFVVIEPVRVTEHHGIAIPGTAQEAVTGEGEYIRPWNRLGLGRVLAVGPGARDHEEPGERLAMELQPGQYGAYERASAITVQWEGNDALMVQQEAVKFVIELEEGEDLEAVLDGVELRLNATE